MIANLNDSKERERFFRDANADDLLAERGHIEQLMASVSPAVSESLLHELAERVSYELRFRKPMPI
jgi:hypothetical protein